MRTEQDNRMSPARWWQFALATPFAFGLFCLPTWSWTPLRLGWPIIALFFALALIRQSADLYERRGRRR